MAEEAQTYFVFDVDADEESFRTDLLRQLYEVPDVDPAQPVEEILEMRETIGDLSVSFVYGDALTSTLNLDPDHVPDAISGVPCVRVRLEQLQYTPSKIGEERVDALVGQYLDFVAQFYEQCVEAGHEPSYVLGADPNQVDALDEQYDWPVDVSEGGLRRGILQQVLWHQILPPATVEEIGRERLLDAPGTRIEELAYGAVFLVAYERPYPSGDPSELAEYLDVAGRQYFL